MRKPSSLKAGTLLNGEPERIEQLVMHTFDTCLSPEVFLDILMQGRDRFGSSWTPHLIDLVTQFGRQGLRGGKLSQRKLERVEPDRYHHDVASR